METSIRLAAFNWLEEQVEMFGDVLPRNLLEHGFIYNGSRVTLMGPAGIWKPRFFRSVPLSITAVLDGPYDDSFTEEGYIIYRYRGEDPNHRDNKGLREAMQDQIPLIYFHSIIKGRYLAVWPVYIIGDDPRNLSFTVAVDELSKIFSKNKSLERIPDRKYITTAVKTRLHQKAFREKVLQAYGNQCAFCCLKHSVLLDAAHIIPDKEEKGTPVINNGLSLCKIHHAAFDSYFIGVDPDYRIKIRNDLLDETDGPMLKYGIQELHNRTIILPGNKKQWPDREKLEFRFEKFKNTPA